MKLKNNSKISKKNIMKKRIVKKKSLKKMREKKRKTLKRNYINKKGGNNTSDDVLYLLVSLFELKALKIIDGVSSTNETEEFSDENPLLDSHNNPDVSKRRQYNQASSYYEKALDIVEKYTANNKNILSAIMQAKKDMCEGNKKRLDKKEKNITIEDLRVEESSYLKALDILIKVLPKDVIEINENDLKIINLVIDDKEKRRTTDLLLKTMADCFVLLGDVNKRIGDINEKEFVVREEREIRDNQGNVENPLPPENYVNNYYVISCLYYKNAHEIYFPVLGEKHWHTQFSSLYYMSKLNYLFNIGMLVRLEGPESIKQNLNHRINFNRNLPKISNHREFLSHNVKIVTGDNMQVTGNILDTSWMNEEDATTIIEMIDDKYKIRGSPQSPLESREKEEEITNFLTDYMIYFNHIKLNDTQYYERYITDKEKDDLEKIKTINKEFLSINIDNVNIDEIKKKYDDLLEIRKNIKNIHTFKLLETIHDKPPKCGKVRCGDDLDIDCNVKCKTHIKNEKGGITFCTHLQDEEKKTSVTGYKRTRSKNQCTSSNKKIENNEIGIFHTEDAGYTQNQGHQVKKEQIIGHENGLFKIYLDKSK